MKREVYTERVIIAVERTISYYEGCREEAIEAAHRMAKEGDCFSIGCGQYFCVEPEE